MLGNWPVASRRGWRIFDEARRRRLQGAEQRLRTRFAAEAVKLMRESGEAFAHFQPLADHGGRVALFEGFNEAPVLMPTPPVTRSFHRAQAAITGIVEIDARRCATRTVNVER